MNKEQEKELKALIKINFDGMNGKSIGESILEKRIYSIIYIFIEQNYISIEEHEINKRKIKQKIYNDLMKIAEEGEIEDLRFYVEEYFRKELNL